MSEQIKFEVSAKTARLIGRENIAGVNGALLELIKNSYDADASLCKVLFYMPFPSVRPTFLGDIVNSVLSKEDLSLLSSYYSYNSGKNVYEASKSFSDAEIEALQSILFKYNKIVVLDNGKGMTGEIIKNSWMRIGTNDKEIEFISEKGRVKTGAKGIGRFALDKLSVKTVLFSKNKEDSLVKWSIDWNSFDNSKNLSDINAIFDYPSDKALSNIISDVFGMEEFESIKHYGFETGTIIILSPTREPWSDRIIRALNTNLRGINPLKNVDKFDVSIDNIFNKELSFFDEGIAIDKNDYDYYVTADYDGKDTIDVTINRNEIDLNCQNFMVSSSFSQEAVEFDVNSFWSREKFKLQGYSKDDYSKPFKILLSASEIAKTYLLSDLTKLGKFHFEFYFLKNTSSDLEIVKKVNSKRRKEILNLYSGIKIYRDNFKVRPYGDKDTIFYDWIGLGERSQKSPAAVTHKDSSWRVEPYQIVGSLSIGRVENQFLTDMANREGLNPNETYHILIDILQEIFSRFEYDRQYFLREFKIVKDEIKKRADNKIREIIRNVTEEGRKKENHESQNNQHGNHEDYSSGDYKDAIRLLSEEKDDIVTEEDVMMLLSVSGTATNTFAHEISSLEGLIGGFPSQIRSCLSRIVNEEDYQGLDIFNPYVLIRDHEHTDRILSSWIGTLAKGIKEEDLKLDVIDIKNAIEELADGWRPLLETKFIGVSITTGENAIKSRIRKSDLLLILNNFVLNSSWFLEDVPNRMIFIDLIDDATSFTIQMENNGKPIDTKYKNNPYLMFELRETSKYDKNGKRLGTGIGLWMLKKAASKYSGEIVFHKLKHGTFGFSIKIPKDE